MQANQFLELYQHLAFLKGLSPQIVLHPRFSRCMIYISCWISNSHLEVSSQREQSNCSAFTFIWQVRHVGTKECVKTESIEIRASFAKTTILLWITSLKTCASCRVIAYTRLWTFGFSASLPCWCHRRGARQFLTGWPCFLQL